MVSTITTEQIYPHNWNDTISISVYKNETARTNCIAEVFNTNASKKELLRKLASLTDFSTDVVVMIDNIVTLESIEAFEQTQRMVLSADNRNITLHASKSVLNLLKTLK